MIDKKDLLDDIEENPPEYWSSFSDMMSGLLMIFILFLTMTILQLNIQEDLLHDKEGLLQEKEDEVNRILGVRKMIVEELKKEFEDSNLQLNIDPESGSITFSEGVFFDYDKYEIKEMGKDYLKAFIPKYIEVLLNDKNREYISEIIIGFGILFIGLGIMSDVIKPFSSSPIFADAFTIFGKNPILGLLAGIVVTAIIQSSSASVGILQTLAMIGTVNWSAAIFITLGQNIGTCITAILSSIGTNKTAKRAAAIHLLFNVIGAIIFGTVMFVVFKIYPDFATSKINSVEISAFHTVFNLTNTIILFPFANILIKLSGLFIDDSKVVQADDDYNATLRHLDARILETPSFAVENSIKEVVHMGEITLGNLKVAVEALLKNNKEKAKKVLETEKIIDAHEKIITEYLIKINNLSLTEKQHQIVNNLFKTILNIERVGDHAENLAELAMEKIQHDIYLSDEAYNELSEMCTAATKSFECSIKARETEDPAMILEVERLENMVDSLKDKLRQGHIDRLSQGKCSPQNGVIFIDALINLERISDHAMNIANFVESELE